MLIKVGKNNPRVRVRPIAGKGRGVVATASIPAWRFVASYPGRLCTKPAYTRRWTAGRTTGKYGGDFYEPDERGRPRPRVLDCGDGEGDLAPEFRGAVAPMVNEPEPDGEPNLMWVWNVPRHRLEFWTTADVRAGEELTACYGAPDGYPRDYCTSCVSRSQEVEPELHVVAAPYTAPVPYSSLGPRGVRRAILAALDP